ncbi:MAG: hypothetical protein Fur003_3670 [Candidatus Dojkabacteria bacterium]
MEMDINSYKREYESRLRAASAMIDQIKSKSSEEYNLVLADLEKKRRELAEGLENLGEDAEDNWKKLKEVTGRGLDSLEEELERVWTKVSPWAD